MSLVEESSSSGSQPSAIESAPSAPSAESAESTKKSSSSPSSSSSSSSSFFSVVIARFVDVLPALLITLPAIVWVAIATERASWSSLGRDQGIFQYVAWAIREGEVAYRDVRDVNGPVVTMVHSLFQSLGGSDEHRFRVLDLLFNGIVFVIAGALVPVVVGVKEVDVARSSKNDKSSDVLKKNAHAWLAWGIAAWVVLSAQYVAYGFWDTAQRESFFDWFLLVSIALQAAANGAAPLTATTLRRGRRRTTSAMMIFAAGALSFVPWLGKPTYVLFTASQILAFLVETDLPRRTRLRRLAVFLSGAGLGLGVPFVFLLLRGDVRAWARITFVDIPTMYRFIWPRPASVILTMPGYNTLAILSAATTFGLLILIARRVLPRRAIPIALMPVMGLLSVIVQAKGFPYHFHPVTLGLSFAWIVAIAAIWERSRSTSGSPLICATNLRRAIPIVLSILVGARASNLAREAPFPVVPAESARDKASLESAERLSAYDRIDFFPRALRNAAEYLDANTKPEDRVQTYGMDAYVLFLANRKSATPYIYAYDLNADAALHGTFDPGGLVPTVDDLVRIHAMRDGHEADLMARLERAPPAAFVFIDRSPLMSYEDSVEDFSAHCPKVAVWLRAHYRQTADFEGIRVWLRNDLGKLPPPTVNRPPED